MIQCGTIQHGMAWSGMATLTSKQFNTHLFWDPRVWPFLPCPHGQGQQCSRLLQCSWWLVHRSVRVPCTAALLQHTARSGKVWNHLNPFKTHTHKYSGPTVVLPAAPFSISIFSHCWSILVWAVLQHTDTSKNAKTQAVLQHSDTSKNTKTLVMSWHADTSKNTKVRAVLHHTDTSNNTKT